MKRVTYTYCVIRYAHDPAAGELLNIGVLLYAPDVPFLGACLERRYERLSKIYADFDGDHYRRTLNQFEIALERWKEQLTRGLYKMWNTPQDAAGLGAQIWPDVDLSFRFGPVLAGVTSNPVQALDAVFYRMVTSLNERHESERRSDEEIWAVYKRPLVNTAAGRKLGEKAFTTDDIEIKFEHAFKNGQWQALQPMTMDYARADTMRDKATRWLGNAVALKDNTELGRLYILLGAPQLEAHQLAYVKAKNLLHKMPIPHEFVEEDEAEDFAQELERYMKEHGVIPDREREIIR